MCINDWRLGRLIRSSAQAFSTVTGAGITLKPNKQRVGILFSTTEEPVSGLAGWVLTFDNGAILAGLYPSAFVNINILTHGDLPTHGVTVRKSESEIIGAFTEFFLPETVLTAGLEEFMRQYKQQGY